MTTLTGGYRDFIKQQADFIEISRILFLHSHRAAATTDVTGSSQQILYREKLDAFVSGCYCSLFQIQFTADGDAKDQNATFCALGYQGLEYLLRRKTDGLGRMGSA